MPYVTLNFSKRLGVEVLVVVALMSVSAMAGILYEQDAAFQQGYRSGYLNGYPAGITDALIHVKDLLLQHGIDFNFDLNTTTHQYTLEIVQPPSCPPSDNSSSCLSLRAPVRLDTTIVQCRPYWSNATQGVPSDLCPPGYTLVSTSRHAGVLTADGKDQIACFISSGSGCTSYLIYLSNSGTLYTPTSSDICVASTANCNNELTTNGFTRASGVYTHTAGTNTWTVTHTFTSSGTQTVQTYGWNWSTTSQSTHNLMVSDTSSAKNTVVGDTVAETWTATVN